MSCYIGFASRLYTDKGQVEKVSEVIDLHDIVIALTILSKISNETKLRRNLHLVVFELTDVDEDGCLSPDEVARMIEVIERVLNRENSDIKIRSKAMLDLLSKDRARRKYNWAMKSVGNLEAKCEKEEGLITFQEFSDALARIPSLLNSFLPRYPSLKGVLQSSLAEKEYMVSNHYRDDFVMFRYEMHFLMTSNMNIEQKRVGRKTKTEASGYDRSEVLRNTGLGIATTNQPRTKPSKYTDLQRKDCPGIIKTIDKSVSESALPTQVWEFTNYTSKHYARKECRWSPIIEVEQLESRSSVRRRIVPKSKASLALEEIESELTRLNLKEKDKVDEVTPINTQYFVQKENERLRNIPRYTVEKWS